MTIDQKSMLKAVRVVLDDQRANRDSHNAAPSPAELQEARARLAKIDGVELLLFLRANGNFFQGRLFEL